MANYETVFSGYWISTPFGFRYRAGMLRKGFGTQGPETAKLFRYSKILNGFVELRHLVSVPESINWSLGHQWLETAP
ncbi:unnamed protein product [Rhizophagus irregularis]|uniref:Uncharacterized protein n=1 Tax=Rhizophagus irregularis TaxID=588596 RepID=A0A916EJ59_9GLOM|nr:unnamed protein product [Rhizophagus irregularis]